MHSTSRTKPETINTGVRMVQFKSYTAADSRPGERRRRQTTDDGRWTKPEIDDSEGFVCGLRSVVRGLRNERPFLNDPQNSMNVTSRKMGTRMQTEYPMYPKKLGIATPLSSAIDFTMKFGAFPIYELAPMNTAPTEMAFK